MNKRIVIPTVVILIAAIVVFIVLSRNKYSEESELSTLENAQELTVKIDNVRSDGFEGTVIDAGTNEIFDTDTKVLVTFEDGAQILLSDGTYFSYEEGDDEDTDLSVFEDGESIEVNFETYWNYDGDDYGSHLIQLKSGTVL